MSDSWPDNVGKIDDNGCRCAPDHNPAKRLDLRRVDFHVRQKSGDVNEVTGPGARDEFALCSPAYVAVSREYVRNRLLISVMVDSRPGAGLDFKSAAPQGRIDKEFRRNRGAAFRTRRLCGTEVELLRADNVDRLELSHGPSEWLEVDGSERKGVPEPGPLN